MVLRPYRYTGPAEVVAVLPGLQQRRESLMAVAPYVRWRHCRTEREP